VGGRGKKTRISRRGTEAQRGAFDGVELICVHHDSSTWTSSSEELTRGRRGPMKKDSHRGTEFTEGEGRGFLSKAPRPSAFILSL
jgi:hypothetical protein